MNDMTFVDGLIFKAPHPNAPDFVKMKASIKRQELINWLSSHDDDWINVDIKESKAGKLYGQVDAWVPNETKKQSASATKTDGNFDDDIPF